MIRRVHVAGYRSVRDLSVPLGRINVLTGPNGCGKSNLYNALVLIARAAQGEFARAVAEEGGMPSLLWAGGERVRLQRAKPPKRVVLAFEGEDFAYELQAGLPTPNEYALATLFTLDPRVKEERIWIPDRKPRVELLKREKPSAWLRNSEGRMVAYPFAILKEESVLSQIIEPHLYPEVSVVRNRILSWRFYHHFRTDSGSPLRQPQIAAFTPVLSRDGSDLAAALQSCIESGDAEALHEAVARALGGASLVIDAGAGGFSVGLRVPGLLRPLRVRELSDGQLRFLCLCAVLLSPRPPSLLALNEPETSLHPDLIPALARLLVRAAQETQLWITTHSKALAAAIESQSGSTPLRLKMAEGETMLDRSDA